MSWNLSEAETRLGEVMNRAAAEGPQTINRGDETFVLLRATEYEKLNERRPTFKDWILNGPGLDGVGLERKVSVIREVEL